MSGKITDEQRLKRIIDKFRTNIHSSKPVYESYQQMTTILNRYTTYKTYKQGCRIAVEGLKEFSIKNTDPENKEIDLILQDLLTIFINNVITKNCKTPEDYDFIKIEICKILKALKIHNKPILHNSAIVLNNFTIAASGFKFGDPLVHELIGDMFYESEMYLEMERYYVLGNKDSFTKYVNFLWDYYVQNKANGCEFEEVLSRVIFSYTFIENIKYAKEGSQELLKRYKESTSSVEKTKKNLSISFFADNKYLNFLQLLLIVVQTKNVSFFNKIKAEYPEQTGVYNDYLSYIGEIYFNIKPQQSSGQGFNIMDMMKGFA
jgi:golgi to ER traffic protein 4